MSIDVSRLESGEKGEYDRFVAACSVALVFHTIDYLVFLEEVLGASLEVFVARRDGAIVAVFPCFLKSSSLGLVLNSLPYFGSHGDVLVADSCCDAPEIASAVVSRAMDFCRERGVGSLNIVGHPLCSLVSKIYAQCGLRKWSERTGQITILSHSETAEAAERAMLQACTTKTRNLVRKGMRGGFEIYVSDDERDWAHLAEHHLAGMIRIGGTAKSIDQFLALREAFRANGMCRLYVAYRGKQFAGALLNLYFREWVEYFTPVAVEVFRSEQVLSALIAKAMIDASLEGKRYWNWGGTWSSQVGVYHFKSGWGAQDRAYSYYGMIFDEKLSEMQPSVLLSAFPHFFVRPFGSVEASQK